MGAETTESSIFDELVLVSGRDVHERRPRHPVRRTVAFLVDAVLHLAFALFWMVLFLAAVPGAGVWAVLGVTLGAYVLCSFTHRVFFQNVCRATVGKLLVGLRLLRVDTRDRPSVGELSRHWGACTVMVVLFAPLHLIP
ncbi:RDD family protein [Kutzneria sp. NPDC052558]|uniref:RDD family protein n=1 Tax=Kutzneria sp. NPDC052558 TaxID=3364121 RepID=UPI0037C84293